MKKKIEHHECRYCSSFENEPKVVVGGSDLIPCENCRSMIEDMVSAKDFRKPDDCDTIEDCVQYILEEIRDRSELDWRDYFYTLDEMM